jgi:trehalose/maltose transport system permease protein
VLIVDIWKTTPFMALLILAGLQMVPRDIYEAAKLDGVHPVKVFFKITLPLIRPRWVAIIFRDAGRAAHLRPDLCADAQFGGDQDHVGPVSRENMIDFDKFAYGAAQSTLLFAIIAVFVSLYIWLGKVDLSGRAR